LGRVRPRSCQPVAGPKVKTLTLVVVPPTIKASSSDHESMKGFTVGGAVELYAKARYGGYISSKKVSDDAPL
jgi:hypothetical protein